MVPNRQSLSVPLYPAYIAGLTAPKRQSGRFGGPFGMKGQPGHAGMRGGGCDCAPGGGCGCTGMAASGVDVTQFPGMTNGMRMYTPFMKPSGMGRMGDATSLDSLISSAFGFVSGAVQSSLPATAAVPPSIGSFGAAFTSLTGILPYLVVGYLLYRMQK